jgi:hypothetical protein
MTITLAGINAVLEDAKDQIIQEAVNNEAPLIKFLESVGAVEDYSGDLPSWPVMTTAGHGAAGTHAEGGPYTAPSEYTWQQVQLQNVGRFSESVQITETAFLEMQGQNPSRVADFLVSNLNNAARRMLVKMGALLINNDPETPGNANAPHGIESWVGAANTVCAINRGANTWWQSYVNAAGGGVAVTAVLMTDILDTINTVRGGQITHLFGTAGQMRNAAALATVPTMVYDFAGLTNRPPLPVGPTTTYALGCAGYYSGIPLMVLPGAVNTTIRGLKIGGDGFRLCFLKRPTIRGFEQVQNSPNFVATITAHCVTRMDNPWKNSCAITALGAA